MRVSQLKYSIIISKIPKVFVMPRPFPYNKYVKSQIGAEHEFENHERSHLRSTVQRHEDAYVPGSFRPIDEAPSKVSIKSKFNELLDLCKSENRDINSDFRNVVGAERDILDLLRSEFSRQQTQVPQNYNQYVRSNVQNFPPATDYAPTHDYSPIRNYAQPQNYPQPQVDYYQYQEQQPDRTAFLRSKIQDLAEENRQLKQYSGQVERPEDDQEIMELQREISRLKALIPQYEAEISRLGNPVDRNLLRELLEQGERIRQHTISMLKNQSGSGDEEAQFVAQLEDLRRRCKQLEDQNSQLKRATQPSGQSRKYY